MLKKLANGVLAALRGSTLSRSVSETGTLEGLFRSPRPIARANGRPPMALPSSGKLLLNVEDLSEARTMLEGFYDILR